MKTRPLSELEANEKGTVVKVGGRGSIRRRIMDMGLVNGTEIEIIRVAPLGDPIEIHLKGFNLTLRKTEAKDIQVETD